MWNGVVSWCWHFRIHYQILHGLSFIWEGFNDRLNSHLIILDKIWVNCDRFLLNYVFASYSLSAQKAFIMRIIICLKLFILSFPMYLCQIGCSKMIETRGAVWNYFVLFLIIYNKRYLLFTKHRQLHSFLYQSSFSFAVGHIF